MHIKLLIPQAELELELEKDKMAQKRQAPVPIFNKGKRPRLALVAHPGHSNQLPQKQWSNDKHINYNRQPALGTNYGAQENYPAAQNRSYTHHPSNTRQEPSFTHQQKPNHSTSYPRPDNSSTNYQSRPCTSYGQSSGTREGAPVEYKQIPITDYQQKSTFYQQDSNDSQQKYCGYKPNSSNYQQSSSGYQQGPTTAYQQRAPTGYQTKSTDPSSYQQSYQKRPETNSQSYGHQAQKCHQPQQPRQQGNPLTQIQQSNFTPYRIPQQSVPKPPSQTQAASHSSMGETATGKPFEPGKTHSAQTGQAVAKDTSKPQTGQAVAKDTSKRGRPSLRLLTATARGMAHWATYKTHTPLLFEIFGTLGSCGVRLVSHGCKQFTIQTSDGPVDCHFWEIDRSLPPLSGGGYRVVGHWDDKMGVVKCFSVRAVRPGELECERGRVNEVDQEMRRFVGSLHEMNYLHR